MSLTGFNRRRREAAKKAERSPYVATPGFENTPTDVRKRETRRRRRKAETEE